MVSSRRKGMFAPGGLTPPIVRPGSVQKPSRGMFGERPQAQAQRPKANWADGAGMLGAMLRDLDGTMGSNNTANAKAEWDAYVASQEAKLTEEQGMRQQEAMRRLLGGSEGLTPQQRALIEAGAPGAAEAMTDRAFAEPEAYTLSPGSQRYQGKNMVADNPVAEKPVDQWEEYNPPGAPPGLYQKNKTTGAVKRIAAPPSPGVRVSVGGDGDGWKYGKVDPGYRLNDTDPNNPRMEVVQGSPQWEEQQSQIEKDSKNLSGTNMTVGNLINSYATLKKNKAITSQTNSATDNLGAIYSGTGIGQMQDRIGGEVGNLDNAEARGTIEGLSMNALMKMISMSDVSAKAMDSDAEMKAWLSTIKDDNYEAALTKLHVLDTSFGNGQALQQAFENGVIDQATYQYITRRTNDDPMTKQMMDRAQRYAGLEGAIGPDNLTPDEVDEMARLKQELGIE